jgi:hypothetical protein
MTEDVIGARCKSVQLFQGGLGIETSFPFKNLSGKYGTDMVELATIGFEVQ